MDWTLVDFTNGKDAGYLQIQRGGQRVCDAFPYAQGADPNWIRFQAEKIVKTMNDAEAGLSQKDK